MLITITQNLNSNEESTQYTIIKNDIINDRYQFALKCLIEHLNNHEVPRLSTVTIQYQKYKTEFCLDSFGRLNGRTKLYKNDTLYEERKYEKGILITIKRIEGTTGYHPTSTKIPKTKRPPRV